MRQTGLRALRDNTATGSLANRLRRRRFALFLELLAELPAPASVLDVGGTPQFWHQMAAGHDLDIDLTILNTAVERHPTEVEHPRVRVIAGDARDLSAHPNGTFDLVFSNSVIEHVGGRADQLRMAREISRVGRGYFVQTPNYWFPVEPHFLFPFFQFLPVAAKVALVRRLPLAWSGRIRDARKAEQAVRGVRLLRERELANLFPDGVIVKERVAGLPKSLIAVRRW